MPVNPNAAIEITAFRWVPQQVQGLVRDLRARWRTLEDEIKDKDEVAQRFTESLQDLVSELDFEEVVAKIVLNASAAVGSKEFALLVAGDDGGLTCQASTGVPSTSIATLVAWAEAHGARSLDPVVIEDVAAVESLACELMEGALPLDVPIVVDVKSGRDWSEV